MNLMFLVECVYYVIYFGGLIFMIYLSIKIDYDIKKERNKYDKWIK